MGALTISANWDEEAGVWVATSDDILGIVAEAETLEDLHRKLRDLVPELIAENGLAEGAGASVPIEVIARQRLTLHAA